MSVYEMDMIVLDIKWFGSKVASTIGCEFIRVLGGEGPVTDWVATVIFVPDSVNDWLKLFPINLTPSWKLGKKKAKSHYKFVLTGMEENSH